MIHIRKSNSVLVYGEIDFSLIDDENRTLAYNRKNESDEIVVAFNKSESAKLLHIPVTNNGEYYDALNDIQIYSSKDGFIDIEMEPTNAIILIFKN